MQKKQENAKVYPATTSLPKQFVTSMRTLFDIMDEKKSGFVKLSDIERRWQDNGSKGLPQDVIECLRTTTPNNGLLSFDQFCAGLKISLLRNPPSNDGNKSMPTIESQQCTNYLASQSVSHIRSQPLNVITSTSSQWNANNTAAVRPNNALLPIHRSICINNNNEASGCSNTTNLCAPPKPPRTCLNINTRKMVNTVNHVDRLDKAEIRNALQNWQMGILMNEMELKSANLNETTKPLSITTTTTKTTSVPAENVMPPTIIVHQRRESIDGSISSTSAVPISSQNAILHHQKKSYMKRREPRRHTLQNGFDYNNMLKKLKYLEMEKDLLLQGLNAVEIAQNWYFKQISIVQDKIKYLSQMGSLDNDNFSESYKESLNFQRARVNEINRNLYELAETWNYGEYPLHINLALHNPTVSRRNLNETKVVNYNVDMMVNRLRQENCQLNKEMCQTNERLAKLESERQGLLKKLAPFSNSCTELSQ